MPELSRFHGIIIYMYFDDHNPPHFHAKYNGKKAMFDLKEGVFIKGSLPRKESRLVLAWYELHKEDLVSMWETKDFRPIDPL